VPRDHDGDQEADRGPGRPEIGGLVQVRLGDLLDEVETYAAARHLRRADAIRDLVEKGLDAWRKQTEECEHDWIANDYQGRPDAVHCAVCEAVPQEVIAVVGFVTMPCEPEHVLDDPEANFSAHINPALVGEGTLWSCEWDMPGWADE
jgi:hypothetical protein